MTVQEIDSLLDKLRKSWLSADEEDREILKRRARSLIIAKEKIERKQQKKK